MTAMLHADRQPTEPGAPPRAGARVTTPSRFAGLVALLFGALLVVAPVVGNGFARSLAGERLITGARPAVGSDGIVQLRADTDLVIDVGGSILGEAVPALGSALGLSEEQTRRLVAERFPNLAEADARKVELGTALDTTVSNLEAHADEFRRADAIPAAGVHPLVLPIGSMLVGLVLLVCGSFVVSQRAASRRRPALLCTVLVGGAMAALTVGLQLPQKAADAETLLASLTTTEENATRTREQFDLTTAAAVEVREQLLPEAAAALGTTPDALITALQGEFPALAALDELDPALGRIEADVRFREERLDDFALVTPVPMSALSWAFAALGMVLLVVAGTAMWRSRSTGR
jgi:hypothetical protein